MVLLEHQQCPFRQHPDQSNMYAPHIMCPAEKARTQWLWDSLCILKGHFYFIFCLLIAPKILSVANTLLGLPLKQDLVAIFRVPGSGFGSLVLYGGGGSTPSGKFSGMDTRAAASQEKGSRQKKDEGSQWLQEEDQARIEGPLFMTKNPHLEARGSPVPGDHPVSAASYP